MNQQTFDILWKTFGQQSNRQLTVDERNYFYGIQSHYMVIEQHPNGTINYELKINRPNQDIGNRFKITFIGNDLPEFWISYSSGLISTLTTQRVKYSDRRINFKTTEIIKELTKFYDSFKITSNNKMIFQTEDLPKTIEQIERTKKLLTAIKKACRLH